MAERSPVDEDNGGAVGFLQRWSRRKVGGDEVNEEVEQSLETPASAAVDDAGGDGDAEEEAGDARIDPRTGKRFDELTDADMPEPSELSPDSDVSAFFARGVSQAVRLAALRTLWHSAKFNQVDLMAEYSGDFTNYEKLGNVVTHDMHRAVKREMDRARERQEALDASAREDAEAREAGVERHEAASGDASEHDDVGQNDPSAVQHSGSNGPADSSEGQPASRTEDTSEAREEGSPERRRDSSGDV